MSRAIPYTPESPPLPPVGAAESVPSAKRNTTPNGATEKKPLTVRSIAEIMAYEPDENDLILADGYLCKEERTVWLGQGGLGKSRLSIQMAICCVLGRDFLGVETRGQGLRWLFLQTENGMRRLKSDLEHMRRAYTDAEWKLVEEHVFFHTLEGDEDGIILLNDPDHFARAEELILRVKADVIVVDPLRDSHGGDLNGDQEMTLATRNLARLAKVGGRADRGLLVLHHARTGKAGASSTTGFDRSSFGRNSKVLQGWTRAQVNLAPGSADNNDVLVVASGKNNNFPEFKPFAIELDKRTMRYEVKHGFDMEAWQAEITGSKKGMKPAGEAEILKVLTDAGGRLEKKALIERAKVKTGRGEQHLRKVIGTMVEAEDLQEHREPRTGKPAAVFITIPAQADEDDDL